MELNYESRNETDEFLNSFAFSGEHGLVLFWFSINPAGFWHIPDGLNGDFDKGEVWG